MLASQTAVPLRERLCFDDGWKFALGNAADPRRDFGFGSGDEFAKSGGGPGPISTRFFDGSWRNVTLPHDWAVETEFTDHGDVGHGSKKIGMAFPENAIGWYRKTFELPPAAAGKRVKLDFDGVFRDSQVWVNGHFVGGCRSGYESFGFDVTDLLNENGKNVVTVRANAGENEGWFYEGAGIYRHTWLSFLPQVHLKKGGTFGMATVQGDHASVELRQEVQNETGAPASGRLVWALRAPSGEEVASGSEALRLPFLETEALESKCVVNDPQLWSLEDPKQYTLISKVEVQGKVVDETSTKFGIRSIRFDKDNGFFLNGKHVWIKGFCNHQDHAGVGSAIPDRLQVYRLQKLKEIGCNAYRTSHNPPTPELLDACDKMGILVMDETRAFSSGDEGLHELEALVRRDRNHPSVILWSIGNEEPDQSSDRGKRVAHSMIRAIRKLDPSRPITMAENSGSNKGAAEEVDVRGFNYLDYVVNHKVDEYHAANPDKPLFGSEESSALSTRGEYVADRAKGYLTGYDIYAPRWGSLAEQWLKLYNSKPYLAGGFVWTGFDYRGEPTPYGWPCISSHFGVLDTCGFPKDLAYYYQAWWGSKPVLHLLPHWNWAGKEGTPIEVWAFTNVEKVHLFLNGKDLGERAVEKFDHAQWTVNYEPGTLEAVGYVAGKEVARSKVETTGPASSVEIAPNTIEIAADGHDVAIFDISCYDAKGRPVANASDPLTFKVFGPGEIIGVGNGDPSSHEPDVFVSAPLSISIEGWKYKIGATEADAANVNDLEKAGGAPVNVDIGAFSMDMPNTKAAYWTSFDLSDAQLASGLDKLRFGQIADNGEVYLNGTSVGKHEGRGEAFEVSVSKLLKAGRNDLLVFVENRQNRGGLGQGVSLSGVASGVAWKRSLFNGHAQVIVRSTGKQGVITLLASGPGIKEDRIAVSAR
jgi:beta-galactosidase